MRFILKGKKLKGRWDLFKIKGSDSKEAWFLKKYADEAATQIGHILEKSPESIKSGHTIENLSALGANNSGKHKKEAEKNKDSAKKIKFTLPSIPFSYDFSPQFATLSNKVPQGKKWMFEVKFDGYRILIFKKGNKVLIKSRNNLDWTKKFQNIAKEIKKLPVKNLVLDGEITVLDKDFQLLQNAIDKAEQAPFIYYLFDLLYYDHYDLRTLPLLERKEILKTLIANQSTLLRYSEHSDKEGEEVFKRARALHLEGLIAKKADSFYESGRSKTWLNIKCVKRKEFVIGGFTLPKGERTYFGSLLLGVYNKEGKLDYVSKVGTGFSESSLNKIYQELQKRISSKNYFTSKPPQSSKAIWVKPELVAEVESTEWTNKNGIRHPSFKRLRLDKKPKNIYREKEIALSKLEKDIRKEKINKTKVILTSPQKILYTEDNISKQNLFDYYQEVASHMLPYIKIAYSPWFAVLIIKMNVFFKNT